MNKNDRYCILVVGREHATQSLIEITPEREVREIDFKEHLKIDDPSTAPLRLGGRWSSIVGLHPSIAYSIRLPLKVERNESHGPHLTGPEVENLLTKEVSSRFIQLRDEASNALGIDSIDTILADSRVSNFKVNGRRVLHPVGCVAKDFEATAELTFTSRKLYEGIKRYFNRHRFFVGDAGRAVLQALSREGKLPIGLLALDHPQSVYLRLDKATSRQAALKQAAVSWSSDSLLETLKTAWRLDHESAQDVWEAFHEERLPKEAQNFLEEKFRKVLGPLEKVIKKIPARGQSFMISSRSIPSKIFHTDKLTSPAPLLVERLEKMGFTIEGEEEPRFADSSLVLGAIEDYFSDRGHTDINRWLRRRLHWLGSVEYN